jgi:hypothetical protein
MPTRTRQRPALSARAARGGRAEACPGAQAVSPLFINLYGRLPTIAQQFGPIPGERGELLVLDAHLWPGAQLLGHVVCKWRHDGYKNAW